MANKPKKILLTGYKGYIGSRLLKRIMADRSMAGTEVHGIDLRDGNDLVTSPLPMDVDVVYHLAGQSGAMPSMKNPIWDAHANIMSAIRLAGFYAKRAKIIYTTSGAAIDPKSPYGISKKTAEEYFKLFAKDNTVICRLSSVFGDKPRGVVDTFVNAKKTVKVYGDGSAVRDFVHVDDVVEGLFKAMQWDAGEYEMGSGKGTTIKEIAEATGKGIIYEDARPGELHTAVLRNTTPQAKLFGFPVNVGTKKKSEPMHDWEPKVDVLEYVRSKH